MTWTATQAEPGADVHVFPDGDLVEHEETDNCVCGPLIDPAERSDGSVGWVMVHHSLDGREAHE